jgi:hypothetical protein
MIEDYFLCVFLSDWNKFHEIYGSVQTNVVSCFEEHRGISGILGTEG